MSKITVGYFISEQNKRWLAKEAAKEQRSASWYLNELLNRIREAEDAK